MRPSPSRLALTAACACFALPVLAQVSSSSPRPVARATALATAPVIDGDIADDPAWQDLEPIDDFWQIQPDAGHPASQRTEVFVGFTGDALYVGAIAHDAQPSGIIATDSRRDSSLDDSDSFRVLIDGLLDRQNGYVFGTNPASVEFDGQVTGEAELNLNWDTSWTVQSRVHDGGWSTEMEIPFTSLRFGSTPEQTWGFNFERRIRRNNEIAFWAPLSQERTLNRVSEAGSIEGIEVPRQRNLRFMPYVLGRSRRGDAATQSRSDTQTGFDLKYSITPSLTLDLTANTDFAQVEVDEQQINLDRFSLFFPEKRAFFLENAALFTVGKPEEVELFFSRQIGIAEGAPVPLDGGIRLSGKIGAATNVGFLRMSSERVEGLAPANDFTVLRVNQELENRSAIGVLFVDRSGDGSIIGDRDLDQNQTYALDGRWGIGANSSIEAWAAETRTPGLTGRDEAFALSGEYSDADWTYALGYTQVGADFNPEVGYLDWSDYRSVEGWIYRRLRPRSSSKLFEIRPHAVYYGYWDFEGFQESGYLHLDADWELESGRQFNAAVNFTREGLKEPFEITPGVIIPADTYDHEELELYYLGDASAPLNVELDATIGGRFGGDYLNVEPTIRYRIGEKFSAELAYQHNDFDLPVLGGDFTLDLWRMRVSYSFSPRVLLQMLVQYNEEEGARSANLRFSWLQSANTGLHVVYNEVDERGIGAQPRGRELIVKYSRIFDLFR